MWADPRNRFLVPVTTTSRVGQRAPMALPSRGRLFALAAALALPGLVGCSQSGATGDPEPRDPEDGSTASAGATCGDGVVDADEECDALCPGDQLVVQAFVGNNGSTAMTTAGTVSVYGRTGDTLELLGSTPYEEPVRQGQMGGAVPPTVPAGDYEALVLAVTTDEPECITDNNTLTLELQACVTP